MAESSLLLGQIEDVLTWMSLSHAKGDSLPLMHFNRAEPMFLSYLDAASETADLMPLAHMLDEQVTPRDVGYTIDVATIGGVGDVDYSESIDDRARTLEERRSKTSRYGFGRVRVAKDAAALRLCRGARLKSNVMSRYDCAIVDEGTATARSNSLHAAWLRGKWIYAGRPDAPPWHSQATIEHTEWHIKVAFARRYSWRVCLGYEGFPSIAFATDPVGAAEVFRLRDVPEGRSRRAALLHWVSEHWRRKRASDPSATVSVRAHLKGAKRFAWNGLSCEVIPSTYDLARLEAAE